MCHSLQGLGRLHFWIPCFKVLHSSQDLLIEEDKEEVRVRSILERTLTRIEDDDDSTICEESGTELLDDSDDAVESASNSII